jgi:RecB family exonuclease
MIDYISQSTFGMFLRCPQQYERRYVRGEIIPPGIAARRGSATHKAAQINHEQKLTSREDLPTDTLQDAARDHYVKLVKEEGVFIPKDRVSEKGALLAGGLDAATRLTKLYHDALAPQIMPALVEKRLSIDAGLSLPIMGTVDVLTEDNVLIDMKTAAKSKAQKDADTSLQLSFYSGLAARHTGKWPAKITLDVLVDNKIPKHQRLITHRNGKDWASLLSRLQIFVAQLETGLFPPCSPDSWACSQDFCGYWWTCKWGEKR